MEFVPIWDLLVHFPSLNSRRSLGPRSALIRGGASRNPHQRLKFHGESMRNSRYSLNSAVHWKRILGHGAKSPKFHGIHSSLGSSCSSSISELLEIFGIVISSDPRFSPGDPSALPMGSPLRASPTPTTQAQPSLESRHSPESRHSHHSPPPRARLGRDFRWISRDFSRGSRWQICNNLFTGGSGQGSL